MFKGLLSVLCSVVAFATISASPVQAAYPDRPITVVIPFAAGGETDIVGRILAQELSKALGQNVAVQNIVSAGGVLGMSNVEQAPADGYTLGFSPSAPLAIFPYIRNVPYKVDTLSYIGRAVSAPYILLTQKENSWKTIEELVEAAKAAPSKFFWASTGPGSVPFLAIQNALNEMDVKVTHVPFSGDADAFQALAGNRVQLFTSTAGTVQSFDVHPLAVMAEERIPTMSEVPTLKELGYDATFNQWFALFGPANLPADVVTALSAAMEKATASPEFTDALKKFNLEPGYLNAADTQSFIKEEVQRNIDLIKALQK